jgi:hypothetical protein
VEADRKSGVMLRVRTGCVPVGPEILGAFVLAVLLGTVACVGAASAAGQDPVGLAEQAAKAYWGDSPCNGQVSVQWQTHTPQPALPGTEVEAWVTFQTPLGPTNFAAAPATYTECVVNISRISWPNYDSTVEAYPQFCQMMIHEYGHFEGYADSTSYAPTDLRYPLLTDANLPGACRYDISAGTGLPPNGFPPLPGTVATNARAGSRPIRRGCFEVRCLGVVRVRQSRQRRPLVAH